MEIVKIVCVHSNVGSKHGRMSELFNWKLIDLYFGVFLFENSTDSYFRMVGWSLQFEKILKKVLLDSICSFICISCGLSWKRSESAKRHGLMSGGRNFKISVVLKYFMLVCDWKFEVSWEISRLYSFGYVLWTCLIIKVIGL